MAQQFKLTTRIEPKIKRSFKNEHSTYAFVAFAEVLKHALVLIVKKIICNDQRKFNILYLKCSKQNLQH